MYLIGSKRTDIINMDKVMSLSIENKTVCYRCSINDRYQVIGRYATEERAKEVWEQMLNDLFPQPIVARKITSDIKDSLIDPIIKINDIRSQAEFVAYYLPTE